MADMLCMIFKSEVRDLEIPVGGVSQLFQITISQGAVSAVAAVGDHFIQNKGEKYVIKKYYLKRLSLSAQF